MRTLSRLLGRTSARFLEDVYAIPHSSLLSIDREVLRHDIPKPPLDHLQGVLIDEKYVGVRKGFVKGKRFILLKGREKVGQDAGADLREWYVLNRELYVAYLLKEDFRRVFRAKEENEAIMRLIHWIRMSMKSKVAPLMRFAGGIREKFNEIINGVSYRINSARIESANAAIKRIQAKACELFGAEYLLLKLRQIYFMRLQKRYKTPRFFYRQIWNSVLPQK